SFSVFSCISYLVNNHFFFFFFFSSRRRHTRSKRDWSSDVCSSDLGGQTDPFRDHRRHQGHKNHGHRQAVPHQPRVVRGEVIIRRAKSGQKKSQKNENVEPSLAGFDEWCAAGSSP